MDGTPVSAYEAEILIFYDGYILAGTGFTDGDGRYEVAIPATPNPCGSKLVAFVRRDPFPVESDRANVLADPVEACEGVLRGPDFDLPGPPVELDTTRVLGTVTQGGQPAAAFVTLFVESRAWGPHDLMTATTDSAGHYEVVGAVPAYYCDDLQIRTDPEGDAFAGPGACGAEVVDIHVPG